MHILQSANLARGTRGLRSTGTVFPWVRAPASGPRSLPWVSFGLGRSFSNTCSLTSSTQRDPHDRSNPPTLTALDPPDGCTPDRSASPPWHVGTDDARPRVGAQRRPLFSQDPATARSPSPPSGTERPSALTSPGRPPSSLPRAAFPVLAGWRRPTSSHLRVSATGPSPLSPSPTSPAPPRKVGFLPSYLTSSVESFKG